MKKELPGWVVIVGIVVAVVIVGGAMTMGLNGSNRQDPKMVAKPDPEVLNAIKGHMDAYKNKSGN